MDDVPLIKIGFASDLVVRYARLRREWNQARKKHANLPPFKASFLFAFHGTEDDEGEIHRTFSSFRAADPMRGLSRSRPRSREWYEANSPWSKIRKQLALNRHAADDVANDAMTIIRHLQQWQNQWQNQPCIYALPIDGVPLVKIGYATDLFDRYGDIRRDWIKARKEHADLPPFRAKFLFVFPGTKHDEGAIHRTFFRYRELLPTYGLSQSHLIPDSHEWYRSGFAWPAFFEANVAARTSDHSSKLIWPAAIRTDSEMLLEPLQRNEYGRFRSGADYMRALRQERRDQNLCLNCGAKPCPNRVYCRVCLNKEKRKSRRTSAEKLAAPPLRPAKRLTRDVARDRSARAKREGKCVTCRTKYVLTGPADPKTGKRTAVARDINPRTGKPYSTCVRCRKTSAARRPVRQIDG